MSLKATITLFTVALFVSAIWVLAHDLDGEVRGEVRDILAAQQFSTVEHIADSLEAATRVRLVALTDTASMIEPEWLLHTERLHRFLISHKPQYRMFSAGLMVISPQGRGLADIPQVAGREAIDYSASDFFRRALADHTAIGKPMRDPFSGAPVVVMAAPIKDAGGRIVGVLAGAVNILGDDFLGEVVARKRPGGGDIHIVSLRDKLIVSSTDPGLLLQELPATGANGLFDRYRDGRNDSGISRSPAGVEELSSSKQAPTTGWHVIATLPTDLAFRTITSIQKEIYVDAALSSLFIALLLWLYLHRQLAPLSRAAQSLDEMTRGQLPLTPLPAEGSPEIRRLLDSFNHMQQRLVEQKKSLHDVAEQAQLAAKVFERSGEGIMITDAEQRILSVNHAFSEVTGYRAEEVLGKTPHLLSSGRHDADFYRAMWATLQHAGHWQGEIWDRRKNGEVYPEWLRIARVNDADGKLTNYIGVFSDISERKEVEAQIQFMAYHDPLTGLPNRVLAMDHLEMAIAFAERSGGKTALLFLDLDNFKTINDSFGHGVGDKLLEAVAQRLRECTRDTDTVSRQGGDEFLILLTDVADTDAISAVTGKILESLARTFDIDGNELSTSTSIGIAVYPDDDTDIERLLKMADRAMYNAKEEGRNACRFYTEQMNIDAVEHHRIRIGLLHALERNEFVLHYQPQIDLTSGAVVGAEALIRWQHPEQGLLPPGHFIATAEECGLIVPIGDWVLREACRQAAAWRRDGLPHLVVAVNVSALQFKRGDIEASVFAALDAAGLPAACLELELTESILVHDTDRMLETVQRLKARGLKLSIDDFGTGYSSLSYLKRFDVDKLKIDRSFICDMLHDPQDASIVRAIIQMARSLNLRTIAEGVEDEHLLSFLRLQYCDEAQGYYFARPLPADDFARYLANPPSRANA